MPGVASQSTYHCTQVSTFTGTDSVAGCQSLSSIFTSTCLMPTVCAQATPATFTGPASMALSRRGVSMREENLIGAFALYPRGVQ